MLYLCRNVQKEGWYGRNIYAYYIYDMIMVMMARTSPYMFWKDWWVGDMWVFRKGCIIIFFYVKQS